MGSIHPEWRGRGIGRQLMAWSLARAQQHLAASESTLPGWVIMYTEESNTAARSIAELATAITADLGGVLSATERNAAAATDSSQKVSGTEGRIATMIESLRTIAASTQDLAAVSGEQAASSEEIASSVQDIARKVTVGTASAAEAQKTMASEEETARKVAANARELSRLAEELKHTVSAFLFDDGAEVPVPPALPSKPLKR